jgi:hypothetical protein
MARLRLHRPRTPILTSRFRPNLIRPSNYLTDHDGDSILQHVAWLVSRAVG